MVDLTRRGAVLGVASLAAAGAGVTTAASGLQGSVEGQADVEAEQALIVNNVAVGGDLDAKFTRTSDDNTEFQAAVELNNGDKVQFVADVENSAADNLDVQIAVDAPDVFDVTVQNSSEAVKTGDGTFIATIGGGDSSEDVNINAELDDTASPGSYDIGVAINPLSTDEDA